VVLKVLTKAWTLRDSGLDVSYTLRAAAIAEKTPILEKRDWKWFRCWYLPRTYPNSWRCIEPNAW